MTKILEIAKWISILIIIYATTFGIHEYWLFAALGFTVVNCVILTLGSIASLSDEEYIDKIIASVPEGRDFNVLRLAFNVAVDSIAVILIALEGYAEVAALYGASVVLLTLLAMKVYRRWYES